MDAAPPLRRPLLPPQDVAVLDALPPELLDGVLSRLPLRDAVRTSVLARAWRRRWESVPCLKLEWDEGADPGAIINVLERYSCPVSEFGHSCIGFDKASFRHCKQWLRLLSRMEAQSLILHFDISFGFRHELSGSIFSCRELRVLDLHNCEVPDTPRGFAGFPHLTILRLSDVGFPGGARQLEFLTATSRLLENMFLEQIRVVYCDDMSNEWVIHAPKLRRLVIEDCFDHGWQISDLPSLEVAHIRCAYGSDFDKLITGVACARDLQINIRDGLEYALGRLSRPFNNLRSLLLHTSLSVLSCVLSVFCLLRNAPKLEILNIKIVYDSMVDEVESDLLNAQWTDDLFSHVKHVNLMDIMCTLSEMHFIDFVLSKARRLQEFHVGLEEYCQKSNEDALTELVKYKRVSPHAKVFLRRM